MKERIAEFIREKAYKPLTVVELAAAMGVSEKQFPQLQKTLEQMEAVGEVVRTRHERYGAPERMNLAVGRLQGHPKGFGFLVADDRAAEDIFIGRESLNGAWHGDRIMARLSPPARAGGRVEGEVIRILQRATQRVVGTFESARNSGYVTPDDRRLTEDILIAKGATNGARSGEKVVVQIVTWPEARRNAEGKVVERIGMKGEVGVDIVSVIRKFGLPEAFPPKVLQEAESIPETVPEEAVQEEGRRDLRDWTIVTIDGEDAKDLDDAVNVERIGEDVWRLGVHIADVSYYVREGTALDREAYRRATSVYLADRVVPMLPPKLSNGICSLNPQVDRLTLSCVMEINGEGKVLRYEIFPSVIRTAARMTYTKVNEILAGDDQALRAFQPLAPMFREMLSLMEVLRIKRGRRGALDFDLPEAKVKLNDAGWPVEIRRVDRGVAERIIEEFMLVANETVAEHCTRQEVPFMYRIHGEPAPDRLAGLRDFLALFGYNLRLPAEGKVSAKLLQQITDWARGRPEENLINSVLLRTMRQAVYSEENLGHFGLAADYYCHFTSPIRRYPDLVVHRVLRALSTTGINARQRHKWEQLMPEAARHSSDQERVAMEAERETIDLKKAEFMSDKVGETFEGIVSGVGQFGFFVQLPNTVEGLVHVSNLHDDYYSFHDKFYALIGERTRRRFRLGDPVVVRLTRVDVDNRQLDFIVQMDDSPTMTVVPVPAETRSRAVKKRAMAGAPAEQVPTAAPAGDKPGRNRKRRGNKARRAQLEAVEPEAIAAPGREVTRSEEIPAAQEVKPIREAKPITEVNRDAKPTRDANPTLPVRPGLEVPPTREVRTGPETRPVREANPAREVNPAAREVNPAREVRPAARDLNPAAREVNPAREANPAREINPAREVNPAREAQPGGEAKPARPARPARSVRAALAPGEAEPAGQPVVRPARVEQQQRPARAEQQRPARVEQQQRPARAEQQQRPARAEQQQRPARAERQQRPSSARNGKLDMWGVPVPEGRMTRLRVDDDPGVINPFSINPPPARGDRGGRSKAIAEAPFGPAPATADEAAGLPGVVEGAGTGRARRPVRRGRPRPRTPQT